MDGQWAFQPRLERVEQTMLPEAYRPRPEDGKASLAADVHSSQAQLVHDVSDAPHPDLDNILRPLAYIFQ
jgi:hypothetical protein